MVCISRPFTLAEGPLVRIGISSPGTPLSELPHKVVTAWALIDTGAEMSAIFTSLAEEAEVLSFEKRDMVSANHAKPADIYIVDLQVHLSEIVQFPALEVVEFAAPRPFRFRALLGRDVLCRGSFTMANGIYELCL
jgi:hypothetical protein